MTDACAPDSPVWERELLSVEEYRSELLALAPSSHATERLSPTAALGRVLASPALSAIDVPHFRNSSMDGYAVRWADLAGPGSTLRVRGNVAAGVLDVPSVAPGECVRVMTGGAIPPGADTIVPIEMVRAAGREGELIELAELPPQAGAFVRGVGSSCLAGATLAGAGRTITPGVVAALSSGAVTEVEVTRAVRVAVVSTGAELVPPTQRPLPGQVTDVNTDFLASLARAEGAFVTTSPVLPDDPLAVERALRSLADSNDVLVVSGGASVGDHDVARIVLGSQPESAFRHVRMQPGKPQGWARIGSAVAVSLPGNPLSATVSFLQFVAPLIRRWNGQQASSRVARGVLASGFSSPSGRRQFLPVTERYDEHGHVLLTPVHASGSSSHLTTVLADASAFAVIGEDVTQAQPGDIVEIVRLP